MSEESTVVTERHFRYVSEHTLRDDDFLRALKEAARDEGIPAIHVAEEQASFLMVLLKVAGARQVVEVGTLAGYSAIVMARALPPDGRVRTIEVDPRHADFAARWIARSDVASRIELVRGNAREVLPRFAAESADAAFLDADKKSYPAYLAECLRIVRKGGLVLADNAFAFGQLFDERPTDPEAPAMRDFNERIARTPGLHAVIVPMGDGLWVAART